MREMNLEGRQVRWDKLGTCVVGAGKLNELRR